MIKLIISDLDGTFLNEHGDFNRALFHDIKKLIHDKHVAFALCTGKQCERVEELFGNDAENFWILGDSATRIKHRGEYVYQSLIKNLLGQQIIATLEAISREPVIIACTPEGAFIKSSTDPVMEEKVKKSYTRVTKVNAFTDIPYDFVKISLYDSKGRCPTFKPFLHEFFDKAYIVVSEDAWIDIADTGVHKGHTVEKLQAILGVSKDETMAFGDGLNDIELMEMATFSFAMRNAFDETKAAANFITGYNYEDAVMTTIQRVLSLQS